VTLFRRILARLDTCRSRLRERIYGRRYAGVLGAPSGGLRVYGPCVLRIEGRCRVGQGLYIRSRPHNRVEIAVHRGASLRIGERVFINQGARIVATCVIDIGSDVLIGDEVIIMDSDFHPVGGDPSKQAPVRIEDGAWIGARSIILKGVTIGRGSVVGAGTVVTRSVPPGSLVHGAPPVITGLPNDAQECIRDVDAAGLLEDRHRP